MSPSVAEKSNALSVGDNRACSDGRSRKNKYGDDEGTGTRDGGYLPEGIPIQWRWTKEEAAMSVEDLGI